MPLSRSRSRPFALLFGCAAVLLDLGAALAQDNTPPSAPARTMTLADALAYARAHQPIVRASIARIEQQRQAAQVPRGQWLPVLGLTGQLFATTANNTTATYATPTFMDIPRIGATSATATGSFQPYPSTLVAAGVTQEVFDFGRIAAQSAAADALIDVEKQRTRVDLLDVSYTVEEAYFAVFAAKKILHEAHAAVEQSTEHRDLARAGVGTGLRAPIELTRAEATLKRYELGEIRAASGVATAQIVFAAAVGVADPMLDVPEEKPATPGEPPMGEALQQAGARDPRIQQALAQLKADEERTRAIGAELRPDVSVTGTLSGRAGGAEPTNAAGAANGGGWVPNVPNWDVGVILSWPLYDGTVAARKQASRAEEDVRREELALVRYDLTAEIRRAYEAVDVARRALPVLRQELDAANENFKQADARFKAGLGTAVELADAQDVLTAAAIQLDLGEFELARARALLGRAIAEGL